MARAQQRVKRTFEPPVAADPAAPVAVEKAPPAPLVMVERTPPAPDVTVEAAPPAPEVTVDATPPAPEVAVEAAPLAPDTPVEAAPAAPDAPEEAVRGEMSVVNTFLRVCGTRKLAAHSARRGSTSASRARARGHRRAACLVAEVN
jgi:hypothetical protein